jgi:hypothetical protein
MAKNFELVATATFSIRFSQAISRPEKTREKVNSDHAVGPRRIAVGSRWSRRAGLLGSRLSAALLRSVVPIFAHAQRQGGAS